jgi:hypothetical protein
LFVYAYVGVKAVEDSKAETGKNLCDLCVSAVKQFQVIELFFTAEAQRTRRDGGGKFNDLPQSVGGLVVRLGLRLGKFGFWIWESGRRPVAVADQGGEP